MEILGAWSTSSLLLPPGPLEPGLVVPISVPSMGQIDLFKKYLSKTYTVQSNMNHF